MPGQYFKNRMTLRDVDVAGKRVLIRVDFNVPLTEDKRVADDFRIRSSLPTIRYVLDKGAKPILISHLGRPKGRRVEDLSIAPVRYVLEGLLGSKVHFARSCVGEDTRRMAGSVGPGETLLLENARFHPEEEANDDHFSAELASLADLYVNDAFGTAHRAHASTEGVTHHLKPAVAGFLMEKEIEFLGNLVSAPEKPFVAIIGGAKISGKIEVLKNLMRKVDAILLGGGIANTLLKADGVEIGSSLVEEDSIGVAREIMDLAGSSEVTLLLPQDFVVASEVGAGATLETVERGRPIAKGYYIVDIGERTSAAFREWILKARTIFWNGPVGVFEFGDFANGTLEIARTVALASGRGAISVVGGGDTVSALAKAGMRDKVTHISTGGGASLEFVEGKELPGIAALSKQGEA
jgi:phosphoglycerate kinase